MLVFVDESGDSGMKGKVGSSELFVVAAVLFVENADAEKCDKRISEIAAGCFGGKTREFKFAKCSDDYRKKFLAGVAGQDFLYIAFALNKSKIWGEGFLYKDTFYKFTCKLLFENAKRYLKDASVVIDKSGNREFRLQLQKYLKAKINTDREAIKSVRTEVSHSNNLLQLADMVCGAVARSYKENKKDCGEFRAILRKRELGVVLWPRPGKK
jgi:uncharacterized protein DUF3800